MTTPLEPQGHDSRDDRDIPILAMVVAIAAIVIAAVALVLVLRDDNTTETVATTTSAPVTTTTTTETTATSETTLPTTTTETTAESTTTTETASTTTDTDPDAFLSAVWPWPDAADGPAAQRFTDPVDAATSFAVDFVGFTDPIVGEFQAGDQRSGEVEIRNNGVDTPATTVFVRQLGADDTWWVLGSASGNIMIERPEALETLDGVLVVAGQARTFEGNVEVVLRADGLSDPLLVDNVTGRGDGVFGAFDESFPFEQPATTAGAALFIARSAEDGSVWEADVVRVLFATDQ